MLDLIAKVYDTSPSITVGGEGLFTFMSKSNVRRMGLDGPELEAPERREGERSEPDRRGGVSSSGGAARAVPDPEVAAKPKRRRFTADYKRSIVEQAEAGQDAGAIGSLLRREGLYSSHLSTWRRQSRQGELAALSPQKRGRKITVSRCSKRIEN